MKKSKTSHKLAAAATLGMMAASSDAFAAAGAVNAGAVANAGVNALTPYTTLISVVGYVGGFGLAVAGIFKLKEHVDSPGQVKMKDGIIRLAAGGGLLALPWMASIMQGSIGATGAANAFTPIAAFPG
jgi:hypothetical protein